MNRVTVSGPQEGDVAGTDTEGQAVVPGLRAVTRVLVPQLMVGFTPTISYTYSRPQVRDTLINLSKTIS